MSKASIRNLMVATGVSMALALPALAADTAPGSTTNPSATGPTTSSSTGGPTDTSSSMSTGMGSHSNDSSISTQVKSKLSSDSSLSGSNISVSTSGGTVKLTGTVKSSSDKSAAEAAARSVSGVTNVDDQLQVSPSSSSGSMPPPPSLKVAWAQTPSYTTPSSSTSSSASGTGNSSSMSGNSMGGSNNVTTDAELTNQVKAKLLSMPNLSGSNIDVSTKEGKVTLTGTVPDSNTEKAAKSAAESVPGVKKVDSDLKHKKSSTSTSSSSGG